MRLRKLFLGTSAIVAAGAMAITPSAMAASTTVGAYTTGTHNIALSFKSASVTIKFYGITTNITCTGGSASGVTHAGASSTPWATINAISVTCPSIFPGTTIVASATCGIPLNATSGATAGVDTAVTGTANFNNCVAISISNGCTYTIGGTATAVLNETPKSGVYQDLTLSGSTPTVNNPVFCMGMVSNGQTFTLNAVFNVQSPDGLINIS